MQSAINDLENLVRNAARLPVGGKLLIDEAALLKIVQELRKAAPDAEALWQQTVAEHDRVLGEAQAKAQRIMQDAQYGDLDKEAVVQTARQRAHEIQAEAERTALKLREETDRYVLNQFGFLEQRLMRILREVQAGQRALHPEES